MNETALIIIDVQNILVETGFQSNKMMDGEFPFCSIIRLGVKKVSKLSIFSILKIQKIVHWKIGSCLTLKSEVR